MALSSFECADLFTFAFPRFRNGNLVSVVVAFFEVRTLHLSGMNNLLRGEAVAPAKSRGKTSKEFQLCRQLLPSGPNNPTKNVSTMCINKFCTIVVNLLYNENCITHNSDAI